MNNVEFKKFKATVTHSLKLVTPKEADAMLECNIHNRDPKQKKILTMVKAMIDGNFLYTGDTVKFDWDGNVIDGQNRLFSISKSGVAQPILIVRGLDPASAKHMDIGTKRQLRDWLQFLNVKESNIIAPALKALDAYYVEDAPRRIGDSLNKYEIPIDRSLALFKELRNSLEGSAGWAKDHKKGNPMSPAQTATIFHVLSEIDEDLCVTYMNELCCAVGNIEHGSPTWMLRNYLTDMKNEAKCGRRSSLRASQVYKLAILGWNYWVQDYDMPKAVFKLDTDFPSPVVPV